MIYFFSRRAFNPQTGRFSNNPSEMTRYVGIDDVGTTVSKGTLIDKPQWVQKVLMQAGQGPILFFVHGFNTSQAQFLKNLETIRNGLTAQGFAGAVVGYDWPSNGDLFSYASDRTDAKKVAQFLPIDGLAPFMAAAPGKKLHVLAHSMGTYLTLRGFGEVPDSGNPGTVPWKIDQLMFTAADADQTWLNAGAWGALVVERRSNRLTNYYSGMDMTLDVSGKIINGGSLRAGRHGIGTSSPHNAADVNTMGRYLGVVPPNKRTEVKSHNWYYDDPAIYRDMALTMAGTAANAMPTRAPDAGGDQQIIAGLV